MKIIITEDQQNFIEQYLSGGLISEVWALRKVINIINPNQKPSKTQPLETTYRGMIERVLRNNQNLLDEIGVENRNGHYFKVGSKEHSPLAYLNTHYKVAQFFINYFNVPDNATKDEALKIIEDGLNRDFRDLFINDTPMKKEILSYLDRSKNVGDKNEIVAKNYIEKQYEGKFKSVKIVAETGGILDKSGVDIVVVMNDDSTINYQVKPFKFYYIVQNGDLVVRGIAGRTPPNSLQQRWIFVNGDKVLEVDSKNIKEGKFQRDTMYLPSSDLISKSDNLKPWVPKVQPENP